MTLLTQIAYSGLQAAQIAMNSASQNVANVNTPGYSRLNAQFDSVAGFGSMSPGGGVEVSSVRRMADGFHSQQLWRATTQNSYFDSAQQYLGSLEQLMGSEGSSISAGLDQFFSSISAASASPESQALRQQIMIESTNLAQRFNTLNGNIGKQLDGVRGQREAVVTEINGLNSNIAELNEKIADAEAIGGDASTLRDHREKLVGELSKHVDIRTNESPDGNLTVSLSNGQPLVAGKSAGVLKITPQMSGEQEVSLNFVGTDFPLQQDGIGGTLGALYDSEYDSLMPMQDALHDMAGQLTDMVNDTLATGYDLNGNAGQPLFVYDPNSTSQMLEVAPLNPDELAFSSAAGEVGNNDVLLQLADIANQPINLNGSQVTLNDAYAGLLGQVASRSRQNQADLDASIAVIAQAQSQRDSLSAVNLDEEAVNLMNYQQAYQANMKVISTAQTIFNSTLAAF